MSGIVLNGLNGILNAIPLIELKDLLAASEIVDLPMRQVLYEPRIRPRYAYFLTNGIASIVRNAEDGSTVEVGIIGREGLVGSIHLLGSLSVPMQCFMQIAGAGRRLLFSDLEKMHSTLPFLRDRTSEFTQFQLINACELASCNAKHDIEQRLARWLLSVQDRMEGRAFLLTHEFLAGMLAVHRPTVSIVTKHLQQAGIIDNQRGYIKILERHRLEDMACECYGVSRSLLEQLYPDRFLAMHNGFQRRSVEDEGA